jgi:hypothetical protein
MAESMTPVVGMGASWSPHSDWYPCTVVAVISPRKIVTQDDRADVVNGSTIDGSAEYKIAPNPNGAQREWTLRKNGRWVAVGESMNSRSLSLGFRRAYHDPHY